MKTFVISLGGSMVAPAIDKIDVAFLKKFRSVILRYVKKGYRFALITGGGKPCRMWQDALRQIPPLRLRGGQGGLRDDLDWIGIRATQVNAELVRAIFGSVAYNEIVPDPSRRINGFKVLIGAGFKPGHSTDFDAVVRAKTLGAKLVLNISDVQYVYDKDPDKYNNAKPFYKMTWPQFFKIFGTRWVPGANALFDQKAAALARKWGIKVVFISGYDLKNFENFLQGKRFKGTIME